MLDLAHVRSFAVAAAELHFGRAARRLHMTQPPLSRQIQLLEQELGVALFHRAHRAVQLTPAGHAFLPEAEALLQHSEAAARAARQAATAEAGSLTVGFVGAATYGVLPRLVARARAELPHLALDFREMSSAAQLEALAFSRIDLGLIRPLPEPHAMASACVLRERLALALPLAHQLAPRRRPTLKQLHGQDFIMYSPEGRHLYDLLTHGFAAAGVRPRVVQAMSHAQAILALVSTGLGLAIVPEEARNACFDNVVFRPISLGAGVAAELHTVWRPGDANPALPALRALVERAAVPHAALP